MKKILLIALLTLALTQAWSNVQVLNSVVEPVPEALLSQNTGSNFQWRNSSAGQRIIGQSFFAPRNFTLDKVALKLGTTTGSGFYGASFTIKIFATTSKTAPPSGAPVTIQSGVIPGSLQGSNSYLMFDLDDVFLPSGKFYVITFTLDLPAANRDQHLLLSTTDAYPLGCMFQSTDGISYSAAANDLQFYLINAPLSIDVASTAPTTNAAISQEIGTESYPWRAPSGGQRDIGQSFYVPNDIALGKITLRMTEGLQESIKNSNYSVKIYTLSSPKTIGINTVWPLPSETPFWSQQGVVSESLEGEAGEYMTFRVDGAPLKGGQHYLFMLSLDGAAAGTQSFASQTDATIYPNGTAYENTGSGITPVPGTNLAFYLEAISSRAQNLASTTPAPAARVVAQSATANTSYQLKNLTSDPDGTPWRDIGQSFKAEKNLTLSTITLKASGPLNQESEGFENATYSISIYQLSSSTAAPDSAPIKAQTGRIPAMATLDDQGTGNLLTFSIDETKLFKDNYYLIMISLETPGTNRYQDFLISTDGTSPYPNGTLYQDNHDGAGITAVPGSNLQFYIGETDPTPLPATVFNEIFRTAKVANGSFPSTTPLQNITIPPGNYYLPTGGLAFNNLDNGKTINAYGVNLVSSTLDRAIQMTRSSGMTFRGLTIDYNPLPFTQGIVTQVNMTTGYVDVKLDDGYPEAITAFTRCGVNDPVSKKQKADTSPIYATSIAQLGNRTVRINSSASSFTNVVPGDLFVMANALGSAHAITLFYCDNNTLEDITVYAAPMFAVSESQGGGANTYTRLRVMEGPRPATATLPRFRTSVADALYSAGTMVGPLVQDSFAENMADDGIAIHGRYLVALQSTADGLIVAGDGNDRVQVGDVLDITGLDGSVKGEVVVTGATYLPSYSTTDLKAVLNQYVWSAQHAYFTFVMQLQIQTPIETAPGDRIANSNRSGNDFILRGNTILNNRGHGIKVRASNGVIENNVLDGCSRAAIALVPDLNYNEAGYSVNVAIQNNLIKNIGTERSLFYFTTPGAISVCANGWSVVGPPGAPYYAPPYGHQSITIDGNYFDNNRAVNILITSSYDITVSNNTFTNTHPLLIKETSSYGINPHAVIWATQTDGLVFENNTFSNIGPFTKKLLEATSTVTNITGGDELLNWQP